MRVLLQNILCVILCLNFTIQGQSHTVIPEASPPNLQLTSLQEILEKIGERYQIHVSYETSLVSDISIHFDFLPNESLESVVKRLLEKTNLIIEVLDNQFLLVYQDSKKSMRKIRKIRKKMTQIKKLENRGNVFLQKQSNNAKNDFSNIVRRIHKNLAPALITGTIVDVDGIPLIGANVIIETKNTGTVTDIDGKFELEVAPEDRFLLISYIGYESQRIELTGEDTELNIVLLEATSELEEIVVVGYGYQPKASVIGAISSTSVENIQSPSRDLTTSLSGNIGGVIGLARDGQPGSDANEFWIRGISTFNAGSRKPLILVDGVERDIRNIDPAEIESFSILKDATATAVYGVRGANGVILVTTKRGQSGEPQIRFRSEFGFSEPVQLPEFVDGATYMELFNEAAEREIYTKEQILFTREKIDPDLYPDVNWIDVIMRDYTYNQRANLSVSGGSPKVRYSITGSYFHEDGIYNVSQTNDYDANINLHRYNFRSNLDVDLTKSTKLRLNMGGYLMDINYPGNSADEIFTRALEAQPINFPVRFSNGDFAGSLDVRNPYVLVSESGFSQQQKNALQTLVSVQQDLDDIIEGLHILGKFSFDTYNFNAIYRNGNPQIYSTSGRDADGSLINYPVGQGSPGLNFGRQGDGTRAVYTELSLNYRRSFKTHTFGGLILANRREFLNNSTKINDKPIDAITALPYRNQGVSGRITYDYDMRYFAEFNFGLNGSENFPPGKRYGFFPSAAVGWLVSEEKFMQDINFIDMLKLRASHGQVGNDQIGGNRRFAYLEIVNPNAPGYIFGNTANITQGGKTIQEFGSDLTWEVSTKTNLGTEISLLNGLDIQFDYFFEFRKNIFLQRTSIPVETGFLNNPYANLGEMKNKGYDLSLNYFKKWKDWQFVIRGNYSHAANEIVNIDEPAGLSEHLKLEGHPFASMRGFRAERLYEASDFANVEKNILKDGLPISQLGPVRPGDIKYTDINGDGIISPLDKTVLSDKSFHPQTSYGFGATVRYQRFDLGFFFQGIGGATIMLGDTESGGNDESRSRQFYPFSQGNTRGNVHAAVKDRWTVDNPSQDVQFPRLANGNHSNYQPSNWWLRELSFARLQNLELGFSLSKSDMKDKVKNLRVFVRGANLFLIFNDFELWDPALGNNAGVKYPLNRTFTTGLSVEF